MAVLEIALISWLGEGSLRLILNAALAGPGYGRISVLIKTLGLTGGISLTRILIICGSIFLFIPSLEGIEDIHWQWSFIPPLLALSLLPTILGFYCTTKALDYLSAAKVQVTELAEPLFAAVLAWLFLNEIPEGRFFVGA
ncbi:DMT family transporter, partial [Neisseria meningitidis]|nr:DMT family transporter [Neisseria meningitidis]